MDYSIRPATPADFEEIGRISVAAYRADGQLEDGSHYKAVLQDAAARARDAEILVAVDDGRLLGAVAICPFGTKLAEVGRPGELEFRMLSVDPAAQGRGVGEALVRACLDRGRELGCHAVVICTRDEFAHSAKRLYQRLGFVRIPERDWTPVPGISLLAWSVALG